MRCGRLESVDPAGIFLAGQTGVASGQSGYSAMVVRLLVSWMMGSSIRGRKACHYLLSV